LCEFIEKVQIIVKKKIPIWKKIIFIILTLVVAVAALGIIMYSRYFYPTGEIMPGLYAIRNDRNGTPMVNFFVMRLSEEKYIVFDAGSDSEQTLQALQKLNISANDIVAVFITHSDWDHIGSLNLFTNATLYTGITEFQHARRGRGLHNLPPFELPDMPHNIMTDGEAIKIFDRKIRCIYTPGHTSDSVSFLVDDKYLFAGDLFISPKLAYYNEDLQRLNQAKVLEIESVGYVFTSHFGIFKAINFYRWWF